MKTNKGISLIVLVITIIVMIILAGAIILSLNNAGIIGKANEAVEKTNLNQVKTLAELKWAEAYLNPEIDTDKEYRQAVIDGLESEGIDAALYDIQATTSGVTIEKLTIVTELQEIYEFKYYSSLSLAVADVNAGTIGASVDVDKAQATAGIYTVETQDEQGNTTEEVHVVLLKDTEEGATLRPATDMTINLGGNKLTFAADVAMGIRTTANKLTIDGRLPESEMYISGSSVGIRCFQCDKNATLIINGGTYIAETVEETDNTAYEARVLVSATNSNVYVNNAKMKINIKLQNKESLNLKPIIMVVNTLGNLHMNNAEIKIETETSVSYGETTIAGIVAFSSVNNIKDSVIDIITSINPLEGANIYVRRCLCRRYSKCKRMRYYIKR